MAGGVKTGRFYIRLPEETIAEIDGYIKESGMYQAYFLSNALIVGARVMGRQLNPERFYTHEMVDAMSATVSRQTRLTQPPPVTATGSGQTSNPRAPAAPKAHSL